MFRSLLIAAVAAIALPLGIVTAADEPTKKERKLSVSFDTPTPGYVAVISEVRTVGDQVWARVDVEAPKGVVIQVLSTAKATASIPDTPGTVKYLVYGKKGLGNPEARDIVFVDKLSAEEREKLEKEYGAGKVVFSAKK